MIQFEMSNILKSLEIGVVGMAGIFLAMAIIYVASILLIKVFPQNEDEK